MKNISDIKISAGVDNDHIQSKKVGLDVESVASVMNFKFDLVRPLKELRQKMSFNAINRKRSKDSIARPKAKKNITSKDPRLQGI